MSSITDKFYSSNGTVNQDTLEAVLALIQAGELGDMDTKQSLEEHIKGIQGGDITQQEIKYGRIDETIFDDLYGAINKLPNSPPSGGRRKRSTRKRSTRKHKTRHGKKRSLRKTNRKHKSRHHKRNTKRSNKSRKH